MNVATHPQLIIEIADALMTAEQYESALKYYKMLEQGGNKSTVSKVEQYNGIFFMWIVDSAESAFCFVLLAVFVLELRSFGLGVEEDKISSF